MGKTVAIIQARMGSTRLPGKVMMDLCGKTVLAHVIERVRQSRLIDEIVIATTTNNRDDVIVAETKRVGAKVFRGSEKNVLERYYMAALEYGAEVIVRITSDCPLIDPIIIDQMNVQYILKKLDFLSNAGPDTKKRTYPRGMDVAIFSYELLENAHHNAENDFDREHVTPYLYKNCKVNYYTNYQDLSLYRLTLDTMEDFRAIEKIYQELYKGEHDFYLSDIIQVMENNPSIFLINAHIKQKSESRHRQELIKD